MIETVFDGSAERLVLTLPDGGGVYTKGEAERIRDHDRNAKREGSP